MSFLPGRIRVLLFCWLPAACAASPPCTPDEGVVVPVTLNGATPLVTVQVNGKPATMLLDTGASETAFTASGIARLGIVPGKTPDTWVGGVNGLARVSRAEVSSLSLGPLAVAGVSRAVISLPKLEALRPNPGDGLLGVDVLSQADLDLDLPNGRVTLYPTARCRPGLPNWNRPSMLLPTWQTPNLRLGTQIELDGHSLQALFDTGAGPTVINKQAATLLRLPPPPAGAPRVPAGGIGDARHEIYPHRFREMQVGPTRFPNPVLGVINRAGDGFQAAPVILGSQYTGTRRFWLSYATRRIFVEHPAVPSPVTP